MGDRKWADHYGRIVDDDRRRWDERWGDRPLAEPVPPDALVGHEGLLPSAGRALDVACGLGATALWLAGRGLDVTGVDVSPVAVARAEAAAAVQSLSERCRFGVVDLDTGIGEAGPFDVVVCQRFRDPRIYAELADVLAPGGLIVITVLSTVGRADTSSPFLAAPGELELAFAQFRLVSSTEADGEASLVARRPGPR